MKKIIALLLVTVLCLGMFAACNKKNEGPTDAEVLTSALNSLFSLVKNTVVDSVGEKPAADFDVPAQVAVDGKTYPVTWTCDNDQIKIQDSTKANMKTVHLPTKVDTAFEYTLKGTITVGSETGSKEFKFTMPKVDNETPFGVIANPEVGVAYKFGMVQGNLNKILYLVGGMDGYYMATTDNKVEALDVYLETTTGGYYLYTMIDGVKTYINMVVSTSHVNGAYEATASTVYTYDATANTLVATMSPDTKDTEPYAFGTRNDKSYTTIGPVAVSYNGFHCHFFGEGGVAPDLNAGGNEGGNEGGSQGGNTGASAPVAGTEYFYGYDKAGTMYYFTGNNSGGKEYRWELTDNASNALKVTAEAANGGFYISYTVNGAKKYFNIVQNGDFVNLLSQDTAASVWKWDSSINALVVEVNGDSYLPMEYGYGSVEAKKIGYTNENGPSYNLTCVPVVSGGSNSGNQGGTDSGNTGSTSSPNSVTIADYAAANSWVDGNTSGATGYTTIVLGNGATVTAAGEAVQKDDGTYYATNTGKYYVSNQSWRIYQTENATVVITAAEGKTIATVKITYTVKNSGTLTNGDVNVASNDVITVNASSITLGIGNTGDNTKGQAQITAIEVIYA